MVTHFRPSITIILGLAGGLSLGACSRLDVINSPDAPIAVRQAATQSATPDSKAIYIDGSSTVFPITEAIVKAFEKASADQTIPIDAKFSGTGGGFKKFCAGQTDINGASRPILKAEIEACNQAGVRFVELPIAFDALTIVVNPQNTWTKDITVEELRRIWEPAAQGKITNWKQVRSTYPDQPLKLYGPDRDSGTFDYFTQVTTGKDGASRADYTASEDDNQLVVGVSRDKGALGYFGFAYYEAKQDQLKALPVDRGKGAILPSREAVEKAQYQPYARPLFIYINMKASQDKPKLQAFIDFYLKNAKSLVTTVGYIPLPDEGYQLSLDHFYRGKAGTVFDGLPQPDLTIGELLRKQADF